MGEPSRTLLQEVEAYLKEHGVAPSVFGRMAVKDPRFVGDLRNGRQPRKELADRVRRYMGGAGAQADRCGPYAG